MFVIKTKHTRQGFLTEVVFKGGGFGHGVGMCQNGAVGMATLGKSTAEILKHYYIDSEIRRIY
jgi:SpoIID/LytB domain protein